MCVLGRKGGGEGDLGQRRTFLDLGLLHLVVERLLQLELVAFGELVEFDLEPLLVHGALNLLCGNVFGLGWNGSCVRCRTFGLGRRDYIDMKGIGTLTLMK